MVANNMLVARANSDSVSVILFPFSGDCDATDPIALSFQKLSRCLVFIPQLYPDLWKEQGSVIR